MQFPARIAAVITATAIGLASIGTASADELQPGSYELDANGLGTVLVEVSAAGDVRVETLPLDGIGAFEVVLAAEDGLPVIDEIIVAPPGGGEADAVFVDLQPLDEARKEDADALDQVDDDEDDDDTDDGDETATGDDTEDTTADDTTADETETADDTSADETASVDEDTDDTTDADTTA